jgi:hypothetical protein
MASDPLKDVAEESPKDSPVEAPLPITAQAEPVSPVKEWSLAIVLMLLFATICFWFMSYLRS